MVFSKKNRRLKLKDNCARCGACLSFCPVYKSLLLERFSPRGKNYLIHRFSLKDKNQLIKDTVSACLQCGACTKNCSSGTDVAALIRQLRNTSNYYRNLPHFIFDIWDKLGDKKTLSLMKITKDFNTFLKESDTTFYPKGFIGEYNKNLIKYPKSIIQLKKDKKLDKVGIFVGCIQNFILKEKVYNLIKLFSDIEVVVPFKQTCCGLPAFSHGAFKNTVSFIKRNILAFKESGIKTIVTGCSSCAYMISLWPKILPKDDKLLPFATEICKNTYELSSFLLNFFDLKAPFKKLSYNTFAQVPCHHKFSLKGEKDLINIVKYRITEGSYLGEIGCCGFGGSFHIFNKKISESIFQQNIKEKIEQLTSEPEAIVTTCSGCLLRLKQKFNNTKINILHISDLFTIDS